MKRLLFLPVIAFALLVGALWYVWQMNNAYLASALTLDQPAVYIVKPGQSLVGILAQWHNLGYGKATPPLLIRQLQLLQRPLGVQAGHYQLRPGMTIDQGITMLVMGKTVEYKWRITEGTGIVHILSVLRNNKHVDYDLPNIDSRQDVYLLSEQLQLQVANPEGLFFADTYHFPGGTKASALLKKAADMLDRVLTREWQHRQQGLPYTSPYEALIMASIVEKETGLAEERSRIAGVFTSRLQKGMRLQTDPTVIYGIGDDYDGNITRKHLREHTAYNTYVIRGLPPTPIAAVGQSAIHAALHPIEDGSLYFVARGDGSHVFSKTFSEHNKAVARFQIKRHSNYRSSPK